MKRGRTKQKKKKKKRKEKNKKERKKKKKETEISFHSATPTWVKFLQRKLAVFFRAAQKRLNGTGLF